MVDCSIILAPEDQQLKTDELIQKFEDLFEKKEKDLSDLKHLNGHAGAGSFEDESFKMLVLQDAVSPKLRLSINNSPTEPIQKGLICKTFFLEAPEGKNFNLSNFGLTAEDFSFYAMHDLMHDLRFQKLIIGNLITYSPMTIPTEGIGYGATIEGIRNFAPHFTWQGFSIFGPYKNSMYFHPKDQDTPKLRSIFLALAEEIIERFEQGANMEDFLSDNPKF